MPAHRLVGQLRRVALAHEETPGAVARAIVGRRVRQATSQEGERGVELRLGPVGFERGFDVLRCDPPAPQLRGDALSAPLLQLALVLGEAAGVAGVVQQLGLAQLPDRLVDGGRVDPLALEYAAQLGHRAVTASYGRIGEGQCPLEIRMVVRLAQAARSSGRSPPSASLASSGGCTAASGTATGSTPRIS